MSEVIEQKFDDRGNCVYEKYMGEYEIWRKFNEEDDVTYFKSGLTGTKEWYKYDYENDLIYWKNSRGS